MPPKAQLRVVAPIALVAVSAGLLLLRMRRSGKPAEGPAPITTLKPGEVTAEFPTQPPSRPWAEGGGFPGTVPPHFLERSPGGDDA